MTDLSIAKLQALIREECKDELDGPPDADEGEDDDETPVTREDLIEAFENAIVAQKRESLAGHELDAAIKEVLRTEEICRHANEVRGRAVAARDAAHRTAHAAWERVQALATKFGDSDVLTTLAATGGGDK